MKAFGHIENHQPVFTGNQKELRERFLATCKDGTRITEEIQRVRMAKSHQQVKAYFGLALRVILEAFDDRGWDSSLLLGNVVPTGVPVSEGLLKEYLYAVCFPSDDDGNLITISSSKMTTDKQAKLFDDVRNWAASQWHIIIPDPDPDWRTK